MSIKSVPKILLDPVNDEVECRCQGLPWCVVQVSHLGEERRQRVDCYFRAQRQWDTVPCP